MIVECSAWFTHGILPENSNAKILITDGSLKAGLSRYSNIWERYFVLSNTLNFKIPENHIKNILQRSNDLLHLSLAKHIVILCGTDNLHNDSPFEIADCVISTVHILEKYTTTLKLLFTLYVHEINIRL